MVAGVMRRQSKTGGARLRPFARVGALAPRQQLRWRDAQNLGQLADDFESRIVLSIFKPT